LQVIRFENRKQAQRWQRKVKSKKSKGKSMEFNFFTFAF
jgi:hypothetical protein